MDQAVRIEVEDTDVELNGGRDETRRSKDEVLMDDVLNEKSIHVGYHIHH